MVNSTYEILLTTKLDRRLPDNTWITCHKILPLRAYPKSFLTSNYYFSRVLENNKILIDLTKPQVTSLFAQYDDNLQKDTQIQKMYLKNQGKIILSNGENEEVNLWEKFILYWEKCSCQQSSAFRVSFKFLNTTEEPVKLISY